MKKHYNITVTGKVQGVYFRASTRNKAEDWHITGFVENRGDDNVYIEAEGDEEDLKKLAEWCQDGPVYAIVNDVTVEEGEVQDFTDFEIIK